MTYEAPDTTLACIDTQWFEKIDMIEVSVSNTTRHMSNTRYVINFKSLWSIAYDYEHLIKTILCQKKKQNQNKNNGLIWSFNNSNKVGINL